MSESYCADAGFRRVDVVPPQPGPSLRCLLPEHWQRLPVQAAFPDFSDPAALMPLGAFMADGGAMVLSIGGRPAPSQGSPESWLPRLCRQWGFEPGVSAPVALSRERSAAGCTASQATTTGPLHMRLALIEHRGQWITVAAMAPASRWATMESALLSMLATVELEGDGASAGRRPQCN